MAPRFPQFNFPAKTQSIDISNRYDRATFRGSAQFSRRLQKIETKHISHGFIPRLGKEEKRSAASKMGEAQTARAFSRAFIPFDVPRPLRDHVYARRGRRCADSVDSDDILVFSQGLCNWVG
jgi:hypothetical protein